MEAGTMAPPMGRTDTDPDDTPLDGEDPEDGTMHHEIELEGDGQLSLAIGGKNPNVSKVVVRGGAINYNGQMKKGEHATIQLEVVCAEVHLIDKVDSQTREVVETIRKHVLKVEGAQTV